MAHALHSHLVVNGPAVVSLREFLAGAQHPQGAPAAPPPRLRDAMPSPVEKLRQKMVRACALTMAGFSAASIPAVALVRLRWPLVLLLGVAALSFAGTAWLAQQPKRSTWAARLVCVLYVAFLGGSAACYGGLETLASPWMAVGPVLAMFLLGPRFGAVTTGLVALEMTGFAVAQLHGHVFPAPPSSTTGTVLLAVSGAAGVGFCAVLSLFFSRGVEHSLRDRNKLVNALRDERANLAALIENTTDLMLSTDGELRIVTLNSAFASRFQRPDRFPEVGDSVLDHIPASQRDEWRLELERALNGERVFTEQTLGVGPFASTFDMSFNPIFGLDASVAGVSVFARDITDRKRARDEHMRIATALEAAGEAVLLTDLEATVSYANPGFERLTGLPPLDAVSRPLSMLLEESSAARLAEVLRGTTSDSTGWSGELVWKSSDCEDGIISEVTLAPVRSVEGDTVSYVFIARDIRERKRAESELAALQRRVFETSRQAGMAEVATAVLHNVGNVLNSINVSATFIGEKVRDSKRNGVAQLADLLNGQVADLGKFFASDPRGKLVPTYLTQLAQHFDQEQQVLRQEVTALLSNVEHVKTVISMQQSYAKVTGVVEPTDPAALIEDAIRLDGQNNGRNAVTINREFDSVPAAQLERHKALQILHNLFINAKQAMASTDTPPVIRVRLERGPESFRIHVKDSGVGIAPENLLRIFNHGFTTKPTGHGFGLHASANTAREMGGSLNVSSEGLGKGATFTLELPYQPPDRGAPAQSAA